MTDCGQDAGFHADSFVMYTGPTVAPDPAVRGLPEAVGQSVVVILQPVDKRRWPARLAVS